MKIGYYLQQLVESFLFAWGALRTNLLRTFLSLLGVTIGIFAIITVYTLVDALEKNIRDSMSFLGKDVIYVQKWPWTFEDDYPWWKYIKRPPVNYQEYKLLQNRLQQDASVAIFATAGRRTIKHENVSMESVSIQGITYNFQDVSDVRIAQGRYFSLQELELNRPYTIIGAEVASVLFGNENAIGKEIKIKGRNFKVIGVLVRQGSGFLGTPSSDNNCIISFGLFTKLFKVGRMGIEPIIAARPNEGQDGVGFEYELKGTMRALRGLKPAEEDNFALNRPEMISNVIGEVFKVVGIAGTVIGGFAILVGGFGIANIMFVSVRERTSQIGIQKALGATNYFILWQFLFEAVCLSVIGGTAGLFLVSLITLIPQDFLAITLSPKNIFTGLGISAGIGIMAGLLPALAAARLSPVEAMRTV